MQSFETEWQWKKIKIEMTGNIQFYSNISFELDFLLYKSALKIFKDKKK